MVGTSSKSLTPAKHKLLAGRDKAAGPAKILLKAPPGAAFNSMPASPFASAASPSPFSQQTQAEPATHTFSTQRTQSAMIPVQNTLHKGRVSPSGLIGIAETSRRRHTLPAHGLPTLSADTLASMQHADPESVMIEMGVSPCVISASQHSDAISACETAISQHSGPSLHMTAGSQHSNGAPSMSATVAPSAALILRASLLLQPHISASESVDIAAHVHVQMSAPPVSMALNLQSAASVNSMQTWKDRASAQSGRGESEKVKAARLGLFTDQRDAVVDDSTQAAVVVNRIFVSYLQVGWGH